MATVKKLKTKSSYLKERNVVNLATITYSWPPMLRKLDQKVKNFLFTLVLCHKGGVINMVVAIADAKLTQKRNEEHLKLIKLEKS